MVHEHFSEYADESGHNDPCRDLYGEADEASRIPERHRIYAGGSPTGALPVSDAGKSLFPFSQKDL